MKRYGRLNDIYEGGKVANRLNAVKSSIHRLHKSTIKRRIRTSMNRATRLVLKKELTIILNQNE